MGVHVNNPFRDILIFPSYSKGMAVIQWFVDPEWKDAEFYVYKKQDGGQKWEGPINDQPVFGTTYTDTDFKSNNLTDVPWYRIVAFKDKNDTTGIDSQEVALYDRTGRKAFGVAYKILHLKYIQAKTDGIPVLYYPAIVNGKVSQDIDPLTGQRIEQDCSEDASDNQQDSDYGKYYQEGYCPPFLTYIRLTGAKNVKSNILDEGTFQEETQLVDFLPFPPVRTGDLIVDVATDRRWQVNKSIRPQHVKGIIPVGYMANMTLLPKNHEAYRVPVPGNYFHMLHRMQPRVL